VASLSHFAASLSHFAQLANEPLDPTTEQNQSGPCGQDINEFRLIWEFVSNWELRWRAACGPAGEHSRQARSFGSSPICHMNKTVQCTNAQNSQKYNKIVRERGRRVIHKMWWGEQKQCIARNIPIHPVTEKHREEGQKKTQQKSMGASRERLRQGGRGRQRN